MTPEELLTQSLAKLQTANRVDGARNSYRKDSPTEYAKVVGYLGGGSRPSGVVSDMGMGLMLAEDARRALAVVVEPEPEPELRIEGGVHFHGQWAITNARRDAVMDKIAAANLGWFRVDIEWAAIEPSNNSYNAVHAADLDYLVAGAHARGLKVLGILMRTPVWARPAGQPDSAPPVNIAHWTEFCTYAATRWAFDAFQIWNEPNPSQSFFTGTVPQYANLVKAAYPAIKAVRNVPVVLGGPSTNDDVWINDVYAQGTKNFFDVLATQPYEGPSNAPPSSPDSPPARWHYMHFPTVLNVMTSYGDGGKDVWFTEWGYSTHANSGGEQSWELGVTLQQQADYLVQGFEIAKAWPNVKKIFVFKIDNLGGQSGSGGVSVHQDNFGLLYNDLTVKPSYTALKNYLA